MPFIEETIKIINKLGLHARPAALLVQEASKFSSNIELEHDGTRVNGKSIMGVMMLAAAFGSNLKIIANGDDAQESVNGLKKLINSKFDEE
ncbi:MAG: HPr family phosphocarrier protein [Candidatus Latescibacteria bacterium]|nr:HPr family phosphocarrier protein [Candidatus Latescibacterota bacterium]